MTAFFVVSSGRSGTAMLHKALSAADGVEMHHEYMVHIVQPLAVRRYMGLIDAAAAKRVLGETHAAAVRYCGKAHWGDSSNKLSWLIPELAELLPQAKFVHLVRDGRKVASSYFHKLGGECYDDRSTAILRAHIDDPARNPPPPPEKKYWWPLPAASDPAAAAFAGYDQFGRIAWHWAEINRVILEALAALAPQRHMFLRLEELRETPGAVRGLCDFLNLPYRDEYFSMFARPHNVNRPEDRLLDERQRAQFAGIAGRMLARLGYASSGEYVVNY
ncbi:MAG: sulfotransferase [Alphaproteobacteria bacterium]|nr:sulfotransferase [Alphaproteobacteria bacterium]MDE2109518.1 sulfotransferase [Alphaproteobacteria bacterium]MDE2495102.1 sulfotransferase [Alphaproteobacteria bacterium]